LRLIVAGTNMVGEKKGDSVEGKKIHIYTQRRSVREIGQERSLLALY
jgi:hypothetical protein